MNCQEITDRLVFFVDGELPLSESEPVRQHLESCEPCARRARAESAVREAVAATDYHPAPPGLETRIRAALDTAAAAPRRRLVPLWFDRVLSRPVLGAVTAALLVAVGWLAVASFSGSNAIAAVSLQGTLVCADCNAGGVPIEAQRRCKTYGHSTALLTEAGDVVHFVKPDDPDPEVQELLFAPPRRGTRVGIDGRLFRDIGYIEIDHIAEL